MTFYRKQTHNTFNYHYLITVSFKTDNMYLTVITCLKIKQYDQILGAHFSYEKMI